VGLCVILRVTRPLPSILKRKEKITMPEKKAEQKTVGSKEGLIAILFVAIAFVLGLIAQ